MKPKDTILPVRPPFLFEYTPSYSAKQKASVPKEKRRPRQPVFSVGGVPPGNLSTFSIRQVGPSEDFGRVGTTNNSESIHTENSGVPTPDPVTPEQKGLCGCDTY